MNYYKAIKQAYPDIKDEEFMLEDDGSGVKLQKWLYKASPKPTLASLRNAAEAIEADHSINANRQREYPPIGDQLDAILKHLNYMQMNNETNLITELDSVVGKWLAVKAKYPKS